MPGYLSAGPASEGKKISWTRKQSMGNPLAKVNMLRAKANMLRAKVDMPLAKVNMN